MRAQSSTDATGLLPDDTIVSRVRMGDYEAFTHLVRIHYANLCDYAIGYVREGNDAEQIVQDVYIRIWEGHPTWTLRSTVQAYLFRAVRNRCLNLLRNRQNRRQKPDLLRHQTPPVSYRGTDDDLAYGELVAALKTALAELPEKRRHIFVLSRMHGLTSSEVAAVLNISVNTIDTQVRRALSHLRRHLAVFLE